MARTFQKHSGRANSSIFTSLLLESQTNGRLWGGELRDDTKNGCVADYALRRWGRFTRRKFHTDDANQCLHNESGSHGLPNINSSNFACLLVDFREVLCSSANELQQNSNASSREDYIPEILTVLLEILRVYISPLWPFVFCLSFVNNG